MKAAILKFLMGSDILNRLDLNKLLDMIHSLACSRNMEQFKQVVLVLQNFIGCEHIILGMPGEVSTKGTAVHDLNISYPQEWVDLYQAREFWRIDPVVLAAMEQSTPQHWTDIYLRYPPEKEFLGLAQEFGLKDGYTCLTRGRVGLTWTIISMAGNFTNRAAIIDYVLERISPHLHLVLCELRKLGGVANFKRLTKRELEVLKWLQHGKTSWEIAVILKVAEATINFHVKNIKIKLNVVTRSQAVATGIHYGLIGL